MKTREVVTMVGECPQCKSVNLCYQANPKTGGDGGVYYPYVCNACGAAGKEWYTVEYEKTTLDSDEPEEEVSK